MKSNLTVTMQLNVHPSSLMRFDPYGVVDPGKHFIVYSDYIDPVVDFREYLARGVVTLAVAPVTPNDTAVLYMFFTLWRNAMKAKEILLTSSGYFRSRAGSFESKNLKLVDVKIDSVMPVEGESSGRPLYLVRLNAKDNRNRYYFGVYKEPG